MAAELVPIANLKGPKGDRGFQGIPGVNGVENDDAIAAYVSTEGSSETQTALDHRFGAVFNVRRYGAVGDGTANDTAAIQAAIDAAAAVRGKVVFAFGGVYSITKVLLKTGVTLDVSGATLKARSAAGVTALVESPAWLGTGHIEDASIVGGSFDVNGLIYGAVVLRDADRIRVEGITAFGFPTTSATAIRLDWDTNDCRVLNNTITHTLDDPYGTVTSAVGISCVSNTVDDQSGGQNNTLTFVNPTNLSRGHRISGNRVKGGTHGVALVGAAQCVVTDNVLENFGHRGILLSPRACDNTISNNNIRDFNSTGIHMAWGCLRNSITGNTLRTARSGAEGDGIKGYFGCSHNTIADNNISGVTGSATGAAIRFAVGSTGNNISGNTITECLNGIRIQSKLPTPYYQPTTPPAVVGTIIAGNTITVSGTGAAGIRLVEVNGIAIQRVSLIGNTVLGGTVGLEIVEATAFAINSLTAIGNSFAPATKVTLPRGAAHFLSMFGNEGVYEVSRGAYVQMAKAATPTAPASSDVRLYADDNGAGKTRLMALFPTGAAQQVAIQP
ncbi:MULTISPECIES: NosD domain-containing protein [unclassified Microbacterium]|uniref:NosD domain-containing protein n=1 Tax=unclassified Microbacterium TaxID=2609290 RepID=UPI0010F821EA|nr:MULTISPECIES: NosD domain-containing protein [unclassified Microbacterium]